MLVLYETALGYCLFKLSNDAKLGTADLWKEFESPDSANGLFVYFKRTRRCFSSPMHRLKLRGLHRFTSTVTAVEEITAVQEGKLSKGLKQFLSQEILDKGKGKETLAVMDSKLGEFTFRTMRALYFN
jgi:nucleolar protein 58